MAGVVLETLSWKKLIILGLLLLFLLISFFLIGGILAPNPSNVINVLGTKCVNTGGLCNKEWFIPRGSGAERCIQYDSLDDPEIGDNRISANQIVFSFWLPHIREGKQLDFSRWQQTMIAVLQPEIIFNDKNQVADDAILHLDARIGYRDKEDGVNDWKELASSLEERQLTCKMEGQMENGYAYDCELLAFFELGSVHHDYYLVNIKVPLEPYKGINAGIGTLRDITLVAIHQNGGFTKVWLSIKTVMFPVVLAVLVWYWRRILQLTRPANLLERTLFALGIAMSVLNCPLEWLTLVVDMPYMLLITDFRQGGFYAMLMSFWIIFTGEHIMDQTERNKLVLYWKHLLAVVVGCFCPLIFELAERGVQLSNPFFSIWMTDIGTKLALAVIITAAIAAASYFFFLCYMIFCMFRNINAKRIALPSMSSGRFYMDPQKHQSLRSVSLRSLVIFDLHSNLRIKTEIQGSNVQGVIYRFKFLMLTTLVCSALTVVFFIMSQLSEGQWKWGDEDPNLQYTSAFFTGVYGMWNVYVIGLLSLYAPASTNDNSQEEEVQYLPSASEGSTFQSFASNAVAD